MFFIRIKLKLISMIILFVVFLYQNMYMVYVDLKLFD